MASPTGVFDRSIVPLAWGDQSYQVGGWFSEELLSPPDQVGGSYRAIVLVSGVLLQVTDAMLGTGLKPVVLNSGVLQERAASEGTPMVLVGGALVPMPSGGTLLV